MPENLFKSLNTFFLFQRCFGYMFFRYENGFKFTKSARIWMITCAIVQTMAFVKLVEIYLHSYDLYLVVSSTMERTACIVYASFDILFYLMECFLNKIYNNKMLKILNGFSAMEEKLRNLGVRIEYTLHDKWKCLFTFYGCILFVHMISLMYADYKSVGDLKATLYRTSIFFWCCLTQLTLTTTFVNSVFIVRDILRAMNKSIRFCLERNIMCNSNLLTEMECIRKIYQNNFKRLRNVTRILSLRILIMFAMIFCWFTIMVFNLTAVIVASKFVPEYYPIMCYYFCAILYCIVLLVSYVLTAEIYRKEVSMV